MPDGDIDRIHDDCQKQTAGTVELIFTGMKKNPQNEDITEVMAACLVRSKLAPAGYSGADYYRDAPKNFPFGHNDSRFRDCIHDPKGILGKQRRHDASRRRRHTGQFCTTDWTSYRQLLHKVP